MYALQDARTNFLLPYYNTYPAPVPMLISPTMLAPGGSCLEVAVIHSAIHASLTYHELTWADWCNHVNGQEYGTPSTREDITTAAFQAKYVRVYNGQPTITVYVVTPNTGNTNGQCWYGGVYNYQAGGYEQKASSCGPTQSPFGTAGWTMYEDYSLFYNNDCPSIPSHRSEIIQLYHPAYGYGVQFTNYPTDYGTLNQTNFGDCFNIGTYSFQSPAPNTLPNSWKIVTPVP